MNEDTLQTVQAWRHRGDDVAVATVVRTYRSAPRPLGSIFAVSSRGDMAGSVSGGCVEGAIYGEAQELFGGADAPKLLHYGISDDFALDVGLACGGELWVALDRHQDRPALRRGAIATRGHGPAGRPAARATTPIATSFEGDVEGDLRARARGRRSARSVETERSRSLELDDDALAFVESVHPAPRMVIVGAVDTSRGHLPHGRHPRLAHRRDRPARQVRDPRAAAERAGDRRGLARRGLRRRSAWSGPTR